MSCGDKVQGSNPWFYLIGVAGSLDKHIKLFGLIIIYKKLARYFSYEVGQCSVCATLMFSSVDEVKVYVSR
jgi:hypothetical protein